MKINWNKIWKKVPGIIRHDFVRKLIALILTGFIFLTVKETIKKPDEEKILDVELENIPERYTLRHKHKNVKLIRLSGIKDKPRISLIVVEKRSLWEFLRSFHDISGYSLNLKQAFRKHLYKEGSLYKINVTEAMIIPPPGIEIKSIKSSRVLELVYDEVAEKNVPVEVNLKKDELDGNYCTGKITVSPENVSISGPATIVNDLKSVKTSPIPLKDIIKSFDYPAKLASLDNSLQISPDKVFVQIEIRENIKEIEFKNQKIRAMNDSSLFNFEIIGGTSHATVKVKGFVDRINAIKPDHVKPYIDISHLNSPGIYSVELGCWVSDNSIEVVKIEPSNIKVKISRK